MSVVLGFMVATGAGLAWGGSLYRWTDADGTVHFGDHPGSRNAETITLPKFSPAAGATSSQDAGKAQDKAAWCADVSRKIAVLENNDKVYTVDDSGNKTYLSDAQRQAKRDELIQQHAAFCKASSE